MTCGRCRLLGRGGEGSSGATGPRQVAVLLLAVAACRSVGPSRAVPCGCCLSPFPGGGLYRVWSAERSLAAGGKSAAAAAPHPAAPECPARTWRSAGVGAVPVWVRCRVQPALQPRGVSGSGARLSVTPSPVPESAGHDLHSRGLLPTHPVPWIPLTHHRCRWVPPLLVRRCQSCGSSPKDLSLLPLAEPGRGKEKRAGREQGKGTSLSCDRSWWTHGPFPKPHARTQHWGNPGCYRLSFLLFWVTLQQQLGDSRKSELQSACSPIWPLHYTCGV